MRSKEFLSERALILRDPIYIACIGLARHSKGEDQRYGSILRIDGETAGSGFNRAVAHPSFGKLIRAIYQGYSNHAEIEALCDALAKGIDVRGAEIFVGGYFPKMGNLLFLKNEFTCLRCPPILSAYGISKINVPTPGGWIPKSISEAHLEAGSYTNGGTYKNRVDSVIGRWTIEDLPNI